MLVGAGVEKRDDGADLNTWQDGSCLDVVVMK